MATTTVSNYVIWARHIHGDPQLVARIHELWAGQTIELEVDGVRGTWRKMDNGADQRPTPGVRPIGAARAAWRALYKRRRGEAVTIVETALQAGVAEAAEAERRRPLLFPPLAKTEDERQAALERLLNGWRLGCRSDAPYGPREELYDRE
jgi:hypothetical protein